jgi:hypothetical protein
MESVWVEVNPDPDYRAGYKDATVKIGRNTTKSSIAHEVGHYLEDHDQDLLQAEFDYVVKRTNLDTSKKTQIDGRETHPDAFKNPYTGKLYYRNIGTPEAPKFTNELFATEVLSTGIQQLMENPWEFAREDPEHCAFVLGALTAYRKKKW